MSEAKTHNFKNTKCKEAYVPPPTVLSKQQLTVLCTSRITNPYFVFGILNQPSLPCVFFIRVRLESKCSYESEKILTVIKGLE